MRHLILLPLLVSAHAHSSQLLFLDQVAYVDQPTFNPPTIHNDKSYTLQLDPDQSIEGSPDSYVSLTKGAKGIRLDQRCIPIPSEASLTERESVFKQIQDRWIRYLAGDHGVKEYILGPYRVRFSDLFKVSITVGKASSLYKATFSFDQSTAKDNPLIAANSMVFSTNDHRHVHCLEDNTKVFDFPNHPLFRLSKDGHLRPVDIATAIRLGHFTPNTKPSLASDSSMGSSISGRTLPPNRAILAKIASNIRHLDPTSSWRVTSLHDLSAKIADKPPVPTVQVFSSTERAIKLYSKDISASHPPSKTYSIIDSSSLPRPLVIYSKGDSIKYIYEVVLYSEKKYGSPPPSPNMRAAVPPLPITIPTSPSLSSSSIKSTSNPRSLSSPTSSRSLRPSFIPNSKYRYNPNIRSNSMFNLRSISSPKFRVRHSSLSNIRHGFESIPISKLKSNPSPNPTVEMDSEPESNVEFTSNPHTSPIPHLMSSSGSLFRSAHQAPCRPLSINIPIPSALLTLF